LDNPWKFKAPIFRFVYNICYQETSVETLIDFLNIILGRNELPSKWKEVGNTVAVPSSTQKKTFDPIVDLFELSPQVKPILYLIMHYVRQEGSELHIDLINMMQEVFLPPDFNPALKKIFNLGFKVANTIHLKTTDFSQKIDKCGGNLSMDKDAAKFVKKMLRFLNRNSIQKDTFNRLQDNTVMNKI